MSNYQAQYFDGNQYSLLTPNTSKSTETFGGLTSDKFATKEYSDKAFYTFHIALDNTTPSYSLNLASQNLNSFLYLGYCVRNVNLRYQSRLTIYCGTNKIVDGGYNYYGIGRAVLFLLSGDDLNGLNQFGDSGSNGNNFNFIYLNKNTLLQSRLTFNNTSRAEGNFICDFLVCLK